MSIITTASGRAFNVLHPTPDQIHIEDIAHHLSHLCRFTGATGTLYTVAEHSVRVSNSVPLEDALWGLLHDAAEAYVGDLNKPTKELPELAGYRQIITRIEHAVCRRWGLPLAMPESVRRKDAEWGEVERRCLVLREGGGWQPQYCWTPLVARQRFFQRFYELVPGTGAR